MSVIAIEITGETKDLAAALQKSEKHGETLENKLAKVGKTGSDAFSKMGKEAGAFALGLAGVGSVHSIFEKVVELARKSIEEMRKLQREAFHEQETFSDALGAFLDKNKSMGQAQVKEWTMFAEKQGATGVKGGAEGVLGAATGLRAAAPGSSAEDQRAALAKAVQNKLLNPETDLASFATAVLKLMDGQKMNLEQAANTVSTAAAQTGGNVAGLAESVGKLKGVAGLAGADIGGALALQSLLTPTMGEDSGQIAGQLLARGATRDIKIGGKKLGLKSEGGLERVTEALDRIDTGEFGDSTKALGEYAKSLGMKGTQGLIALDVIRKDRARLAELNAQFTAGMAPGTDLVAQGLATKAAVMPTSGAVAGTREAKAKAAEAAHSNATAARKAAADMTLEEYKKELGQTHAWEDIGAGIRRLWADRHTGTKPYEAQEKMTAARLAVTPYVFNPLTGFKPGAVSALGKARTPEDILAAGPLYGDMGTGVRLSQEKQRMLSAAGAAVGMAPDTAEAKIQEIAAKFDEGKYRESDAALKAMLAELREMNMHLRGKAAPRQEAD